MHTGKGDDSDGVVVLLLYCTRVCFHAAQNRTLPFRAGRKVKRSLAQPRPHETSRPHYCIIGQQRNAPVKARRRKAGVIGRHSKQNNITRARQLKHKPNTRSRYLVLALPTQKPPRRHFARVFNNRTYDKNQTGKYKRVMTHGVDQRQRGGGGGGCSQYVKRSSPA